MTISLDEASLLVSVSADTTLAALETTLVAANLTLRLATIPKTTIGDWLAAGAPGAPSMFADPADHLVAGLVAKLVDGRRLEVRPSPRRAVGPDLAALFIGGGGRFGTIENVWLRIHRTSTASPRMTADLPTDAPLSAEESALLDRIARQLSPALDAK